MGDTNATGDRAPSSSTRWGGKRVDNWTRQRADNVRAKSRFNSLRRGGELPELYDVFLGPRFVEKAAAGKLYAFPLLNRRYVTQALPVAAKWSLAPRHIAALSWVITAHLVCRTKGLVISHATMAGLLVGHGRGGAALSERHTGQTMRELAKWGLLEVEPWFGECDGLWMRQSSWYRVSAFAVRFFDLARIAKQNDPRFARYPDSVVSADGDAADGGRAQDASSVQSVLEGVKARCAASPDNGPVRGGCANPPLVRTRSALAERVQALASKRIDEVTRPVLAAAATVAREAQASRARVRELEARELARQDGERESAGVASYADQRAAELAELRRSVGKP